MAATINTLRYARRMETAGLPRAQAEAIAEGVAEELESNLEQRLERIETGLSELRAETTELRGEMRAGLTELRGEMRTIAADLRGEIARSRVETLRWLVPLLLTLILAVLAQASGTFFLILRATGGLPDGP